MPSNTGDMIRKYRKEKGLTQKQLEELCGIADSNIRKYESGKQNPKLETLKRIASALGVLPGDLLQDGFYPTSEEIAAMKRGAESITDERKVEIEEKRLSNLIKRKEKLLNNAGKKKAVSYIDDLTKIPEYRKEERSIPELNAAHARTDIDIPEGTDTSDDDIMNDDSEWK